MRTRWYWQEIETLKLTDPRDKRAVVRPSQIGKNHDPLFCIKTISVKKTIKFFFIGIYILFCAFLYVSFCGFAIWLGIAMLPKAGALGVVCGLFFISFGVVAMFRGMPCGPIGNNGNECSGICQPTQNEGWDGSDGGGSSCSGSSGSC